LGAGVLKNAPGTWRIGVAVGWKVEAAMVDLPELLPGLLNHSLPGLLSIAAAADARASRSQKLYRESSSSTFLVRFPSNSSLWLL
jgi:hypothetical protein